MTRTIKFRAWDTANEKRIKGFYIDERGYFYDNGRDLEDGTASLGRELMQFTGLHDKNGKEIYEGDILQIENINGQKGFLEVKIPDVFGWQTSHPFPIEVIGNIYENPELLTGKK